MWLLPDPQSGRGPTCRTEIPRVLYLVNSRLASRHAGPGLGWRWAAVLDSVPLKLYVHREARQSAEMLISLSLRSDPARIFVRDRCLIGIPVYSNTTVSKKRSWMCCHQTLFYIPIRMRRGVEIWCLEIPDGVRRSVAQIDGSPGNVRS